MKRPYVFCHMMTSVDGKIVGNWHSVPEAMICGKYFNDLTFGRVPEGYHMQGWFSGRITTEEAFTGFHKPDLDPNAAEVPSGDYVITMEKPMYYISIDTKGKVGWTENCIRYSGVEARVLEVLTEEASNAYKDLLRKLEIPYIIAGSRKLDIPLMMEKLYEEFGLRTLMLGGGGILNWSFIEQGMCDELSVVQAAAANGDANAQTLFMTAPGISELCPVSFEVKDTKVIDNGKGLWIRYMINNRKN